MPDLNDQHRDFIDLANDYFLGEPNKNIKLKEGEEAPEEPEPVADDDDQEDGAELKSDISEELEIKVPVKALSEIDRVNYVVNAIENDCQVAPVGAYKMTSKHEVCRNESFSGLQPSDALKLTQYCHFRNVLDETKRQQLEAPGIAFDDCFLEDLSKDQPKGCWNFQMAVFNKIALGRSLLWPGFNFYHKVNSNKFGSIYIGDGLKNLELQFMTQ